MTTAAVLALPAVASATITPALTLNQSAGTTAGTSPATVGFNTTFSPTAGDSPKDITFALPPGLLANANQAGGACLATATPSAACQVATGTITDVAGPGQAVSMYLVKAPKASDVAGVQLVNGSSPTGAPVGAPADVTLTTTAPIGLDVAFTNLPNIDLSDLNVTFTTLRLPTSCPSPAANVTVTADSYASSTPQTATAPLNVTGCSGLPYAPTVSATETKDANDNGGTLAFTVIQQADEAATKSIALKLPSGLGVNATADLQCLTGTSGGCNVGTAAATSPLVPSPALANGTVTLGGSLSAPTITISFPAPFALTLVGDVSLAGSGTVTFNNMPDLTLTSLNLDITGPNGQKAFTTKCQQSSASGTFTSQGNVAVGVKGTVTLVNCPPTASGSTSGLASGHPKLRFKVTHTAANIASVAVGLPSGLSFSRSGIVTHKTCTTHQGKKKCTTTTLIKGLGLSGAKAKSVALKGGKLVITLNKAAGSVTVSLSGPVLSESGSLQTKVKKHKTKSVTVTLKVTDAKHTTTSVPVKITAH